MVVWQGWHHSWNGRSMMISSSNESRCRFLAATLMALFSFGCGGGDSDGTGGNGPGKELDGAPMTTEVRVKNATGDAIVATWVDPWKGAQERELPAGTRKSLNSDGDWGPLLPGQVTPKLQITASDNSLLYALPTGAPQGLTPSDGAWESENCFYPSTCVHTLTVPVPISE